MGKRQIPLMLSVPQECRDKLRKMAAKRNLRSPQRVTSASAIARELVLEGIERIEQIEAGLGPPDGLNDNHSSVVEPVKDDHRIQKS